MDPISLLYLPHLAKLSLQLGTYIASLGDASSRAIIYLAIFPVVLAIGPACHMLCAVQYNNLFFLAYFFLCLVLDIYWYKIIHDIDLISFALVTTFDLIAAFMFILLMWNRRRPHTQLLDSERQPETGEITPNAHENIEAEQLIRSRERNSVTVDNGGDTQAQGEQRRPQQHTAHAPMDQSENSAPVASQSNLASDGTRPQSMYLRQQPSYQPTGPAISHSRNRGHTIAVTIPMGDSTIHPALRPPTHGASLATPFQSPYMHHDGPGMSRISRASSDDNFRWDNEGNRI